jgi:hypothetical protein
MILPNPETDLSLSILFLGSDIISLFPKSLKISIDDLLKNFLNRDKRRTPELFFDTLTFLYAIEIIDSKGYKLILNKNDNTEQTLF